MALPLIAAAVGAGAGLLGSAIGGASGAGRNARRRTSFGKTDQYDPNADEWGGRRGGLADYSANLNYRAGTADAREANLANYGRADAWENQSLASRQAQGNAANLMMNRATGAVPSIANQQAALDMQRAQSAQMAAAASARGPAAMALAQQNAANNTANAQAQISGQAQVNAANERMQAERAAFDAYSGMRGQDVNSQGLSTQQAQFQAQQQQANRNANDQRAMGYEQMDFMAQKAQLDAKQREQEMLARSHDSADAGQQQTSQANADNTKSWWEKGISSLSDERAKEPAPQPGMDMNSMASLASNPAIMKAIGGISDARAKQPGSGLARAKGTLSRGPGGVGPGDPNAPRVHFDPVHGWVRPGGEQSPPDTMSPQTFQAELDRQNVQDQADIEIERRLAEQKADDARLAHDPGVGLSRARGYSSRRARPAPDNTAQQDEDRGVAPGTTDFEQSQPKTHSQSPWYATPVRPGAGLAEIAATAALGGGSGKSGQPSYTYNQQTKEWRSSAGGEDLPARADGGPVQAGQPYVVGERGPEVVVPEADGTVVPNEGLPVRLAAKLRPVIDRAAPGLRDKVRQRIEAYGQQAAPEKLVERNDQFNEAHPQMSSAARRLQGMDPLPAPLTERDKQIQKLDEQIALLEKVKEQQNRPKPSSDIVVQLTDTPEGKLQQDPGTGKAFYATEAEHAPRASLAGDTREQLAALQGRPVSAPAKAAPAPKRKMTPDEMMSAANKLEAGMKSDHAARMAKGPAVPPPDKSPVADANRTLVGTPYSYKPEFAPPEQQPGETNFGYMTQNLRQSPVAATAVRQDPATGMDRVDQSKMLKVVAAGVADLQRQQDETRMALARRRRVA